LLRERRLPLRELPDARLLPAPFALRARLKGTALRLAERWHFWLAHELANVSLAHAHLAWQPAWARQ
jgi:hypothetical protein